MNNIHKLFKDETLKELALTHRSWVNEHPNIRQSNERLEFLGDAILEFIVSEEIYKRFPDKEEGFLTALRANLVNTVNLAKVALTLNIGEILLLSKGEEESGGRENSSLLADTMEAIIGALFWDQGINACSNFIHKHILTDSAITEKINEPLKDAKSRFQELVQAEGYPAPKYKVINESGPDHNKIFTLVVLVKDIPCGTGEGRNKSEAAQKAAEDALSNHKLPQINAHNKQIS